MKYMLAAAALALAVTGAAHAEGPNVIKVRQAGQYLLLGDFTAIQQAVAAKADVKKLEKPSMAMARWMQQFVTLFPPGSDTGDNTKALPAIWKDPAGFQKASDHFITEVDKLTQLAKADNAMGFAAQVKVVGRACGACHHDFRAR